GALLKGGDAGLQPDGVAESKEIQTADAERNARAESGSSGRSVQAGSAAANAGDLRSKTCVERVSPGLLHRIDDIFGRLLAFRILKRRVHFGEDAEIVTSPLAVRHFVL